MRALLWGLSLLLGLAWTLPVWGNDLVVVIDDVGYNKARGMRAVHLPGPVTLAVLPFAPHTQVLVDAAVAADRDLLIHQPMQTQSSPHARMEHDTLHMGMNEAEMHEALTRALRAIPNRVGLNNHAGSLLTQHRAPMRSVMTELSKRNLIFLDSRTTAETVAYETANEMGVLAFKRDVFLDNIRTPEAINEAFQKALRVARKNGTAIIIGHPYPATLDYLETALEHLPADIRLVGISELALKRRATLAQRTGPKSPRISLGR